MEKIVKLIVNSRTLIASIEFVNIDTSAINELRLHLSTLSDNLYYLNTSLQLPYSELRRHLPSVVRILKKFSYKINSDSFTETLLKEVVLDKKWVKEKNLKEKLSFKTICNILNELGFKRHLNRRQLRDCQSLLQLKNGANFSVPGAGKTTTLLAVHSIAKQQGLVSKLFIICPINAFISWEDEISLIFDDIKSLKPHRLTIDELNTTGILPIQNSDVVIVNYEKLRRNIKTIVPYFIANKVHLVLDESHRIKSGENNISYNQIIKISDLAKRRDILSGTPMPQSYLDLVPQFNFLWPGEALIPDLSKTKIDSQSLLLNASIKNLFVRTTKNELELKEPNINYEFVSMGPIQNELYKLFKSEAARLLARMDKLPKNNFRRVGRSVIKLLQAATNPMLLGTMDEYDEELIQLPDKAILWELLEEYIRYEKPQKIEMIKLKVQENFKRLPQDKILIWSSFIKNIKLLETIFKEHNPVSIYGGVASGDELDEMSREGRIRKFHNDPTCRIMIANPQACGEGISLHKVCHYAIYLDRTFNAAHYLQSIDRIHRLGLPKDIDTKIDILISKGSIDEVALKRLNEKIINMGNALNDKYLEKLAYDPDDIPEDEQNGLDNEDIMEIKTHVTSNE